MKCMYNLLQIHWKRAARTDKGVSAVGNIVSAKLVLEPPGLVDRINAELPEQVDICKNYVGMITFLLASAFARFASRCLPIQMGMATGQMSFHCTFLLSH
eukprot:scaffold263556_cov16-Prasinocladus_malaysianus.AAC.1